MSEEKFGHIKVDDVNSGQKWDGYVPYLDYWRVRRDQSSLNDAQKQFYVYVQKSLETGEKIKDFGVNAYLLLLRDKLVKDSMKVKSRKAAIVTIKKLNALYGFHDFALDEILKKEAETQRDRRITLFRKKAPAQWIQPGEIVGEGHNLLLRGGFYLGNYVKFAKYNVSEARFYNSSINTEGPVINLTQEAHMVDRNLTRNFTTFVEMSDELQTATLDWLRGRATDNVQVILYYLAGIEMRLLGDRETDNEERRSLIKYLLTLLADESVTEISRLYNIRQIIISLIDFTLARFFTDEAYSILPKGFSAPLPMLRRAHISKLLSSFDPDTTPKEEIIHVVTDHMYVPIWLPEAFVDNYRSHLKAKLREVLISDNYWIKPAELVYKAISAERGFVPDSKVVNGLKTETIKVNHTMNKTVEKVISTINQILNEFSSFAKARNEGAPPMKLARLLPRWCDPKLLTGVDEALKDVLPREDEKFRVIRLGTLLDIIGTRHESTLDVHAMAELNLDLYKIGLRVSTNAIRGAKLGLDETVAVYDCRLGDVSTRGSLLISLFLVAWVVSADGTNERDYRIVDEWLSAVSDNDRQMIPAMAAFRWLANRKLTLSAKRKIRAQQLSKYPKKRDEFIKILLSIFSDPESASPKRMARLQTIYSLIGLNPDDIHSDLHRMATSSAPAVKKRASHAAIDKTKLKAMAQSTRQAQEILSEVFTDESHAETSASAETPESKQGNPTLEILRLLINRAEWPRAEFDALCKESGETVGSMLERLNDCSYDTLDEAVAEDDDDIIYIDTEVARRVMESL